MLLLTRNDQPIYSPYYLNPIWFCCYINNTYTYMRSYWVIRSLLFFIKYRDVNTSSITCYHCVRTCWNLFNKCWVLKYYLLLRGNHLFTLTLCIYRICLHCQLYNNDCMYVNVIVPFVVFTPWPNQLSWLSST